METTPKIQLDRPNANKFSYATSPTPDFRLSIFFLTGKNIGNCALEMQHYDLNLFRWGISTILCINNELAGSPSPKADEHSKAFMSIICQIIVNIRVSESKWEYYSDLPATCKSFIEMGLCSTTKYMTTTTTTATAKPTA
jgi:hypothetical protein